MTTDGMIRELCICLQTEARVYRTLLELSLAQLQALRAKDVHAVHAILQEVEIAMLDRSRIEVKRAQVLTGIAASLAIDEASVTRELIVGMVDAETAAVVASTSDELRTLVDELAVVVGRNRTLLESELDLINTTVQWMTTDRTARPSYHKSGAQGDAPRIRLLDATV